MTIKRGLEIGVAGALLPLLYKWIAPVSSELAAEVAVKYINYFMMSPMIALGTLLYVAFLWQSIMIAKGRTTYPKKAVFYNMVFDVIALSLAAFVIGNNIIGNGIGTAGISFGHLWMFGMMTARLSAEYADESY